MPTKELVKKETVKEAALHSVHLIADFIAPQRFIESAEELEAVLYEAAYAAKNTPLKACIYKFPGQGITGVLVLAESHIAIHTWPEHDYIAVDLFTCGRQTQPHKALEYLKRQFLPAKVRVRDIDRGLYE